ncbi:cytosol aminopeptidase, putative [Eimeria brunetti]|uniref:Cytosol aminopeptidase, putative n=1 Tax=Eimeria brunetti TaxID=51314 RepID=U6LKY4_9EIME|nr:cytosol aminopeptidase, putative [Eimeria brunetti]
MTVFTFDKPETERTLEAARHVAKGVHLARELVNAPANYCTTITLAKAAEAIAKEGDLECKILDQAALEELKMGCYLAVAKGSMYPPQFIHLIYRPKAAAASAAAASPAAASAAAAANAPAAGGPEGAPATAAGGQEAAAAEGSGSPAAAGAGAAGAGAGAAGAAGESSSSSSKPKRIVFVGKGLCFDSGGYNVKRAETSIELMKFDMGGAAAVLGAAAAVAGLSPAAVEVHFLAAAAENMISSRAYRPGDILRASNGKTVEVGNTDAEGRLALADALVFAERLAPDFVVDVATLTGACVVALGEAYAGLVSPDEPLAQRVVHWSVHWTTALFPFFGGWMGSMAAWVFVYLRGFLGFGGVLLLTHLPLSYMHFYPLQSLGALLDWLGGGYLGFLSLIHSFIPLVMYPFVHLSVYPFI